MALTYDEHVARAMLLGREYDPRDHTYTLFSSYPTMLDADTLEGLDLSTCIERKEQVHNGEIGFPTSMWDREFAALAML